MKNRNVFLCTALAVIGVLLLGCGGSVSLTNVWSDPTYSGKSIDNILVIGVTPKPEVRRHFEFQLSHEFKSRGIGSMASVDGIPEDIKLSKENFGQYFGDVNLDAVLVTGLVSADTTEQYTPGTSYAVPVGYYSTWSGYYTTVYSVHREPGYWTENTEFVIESTLYEVATEKLIWRGISKAVNPDNVTEIIEDLSKTLVDQLATDGIVIVQDKQ